MKGKRREVYIWLMLESSYTNFNHYLCDTNCFVFVGKCHQDLEQRKIIH